MRRGNREEKSPGAILKLLFVSAVAAMADESGDGLAVAESGLRKITELRVVIQDEGGNPDEISINPETPSSRASKKTGKGCKAEDCEIEDCTEDDFSGKQAKIPSG
ncbi:hypothetical protein scyTo_0022464 [Scyliorhinus torazame]|uniref:Uncharacterized protein n=1 Tax=Scyliorhinus torazame TaxID=75743 RepID=A0A401Q6X7_SCYTO|nr:hypothetical protein [Scyliorhinus torazame]